MEMYKNNPIAVRNAKIEALEEAKQLFLNALDQFSEENNISEEELSSVKELVEEEYLNKRLSYLLEHKTERFSEYLNASLDSSFRKILSPDDSEATFTRVAYIKHTKQLLTNG